jgi:shikimate dehydrogenase
MRKFGLIGKRLDYSFSKPFFTSLFEEIGEVASYENIEIQSISEVIPYLKSGEFSGFNVTIPYKIEIITYLSELSAEAKQIGAVNTISYENGELIGHNTDAFGFQQSIKPFLTNQHEKALILGTGGASKAIEFVLKNIGLEVFYLSRNPKTNNQFNYEQVNEHMLSAMKLIVNCTPVGTFPTINEKPNFPTHLFGADHLVVDLIYNPEKTRFLQEAEMQGSTILNGLSMLREQALKAWELWNTKN